MSDAEFKVKTGPALAGLKELNETIKRTGAGLDQVDKVARKFLVPATESNERFQKSVSRATETLHKLGGANTAVSKAMDGLQNTSQYVFQGLEANFHSAYRSASVFSKGQEELRALLLKTDHYNEQVRHLRTLASMQEQSGNKAKELAKGVEILSTAEGKALAQARAYSSESNKRAAAETKLTQTIKTQEQALKLLTSEAGRAKVANAERIRSVSSIIAAEERLKSQERELLAQSKLATTAEYQRVQALRNLAAVQAVQEQNSRKAVTYLEQQRAATAALRREESFLASAAGQEQVRLRQQIADTRKEIAKSAQTQEEKNKRTRTGNQLTSALRAGLHGAQVSIGMYTSSTIAAALATFGLARAIRSTLEVGIDFTSTMARTNAIMDTSESMYSALTSQVRLLGQTTAYTASEVAAASTELGQAGLSAGQSMIALQPALDLATIGNISMAKSADHATNILTAFGREASQLTDVVNLLATATTNSNTTIDQLANALSYAGPAAHSAGYAIEETVAAISTLANSGIKSSKAGTAMRRLFVSLVNPTEKGAQVLKDYNITVQELDGSFLSLQDVMNQFDAAFEGKGHERLAAIKDLVGVYAASPIAALMENNDEFNAQIALMSNMGNAAERMKEKINDALSFDLKEVKSAFQELQLTVFEDNEAQLRVWAQEFTGFLQYLGSEGQSGASVLQELGTEIKDIATFMLKLYGTMKLFSLTAKYWSPTVLAAKGARDAILGAATHTARLGTVLKATATSGRASLTTLSVGAAALSTNLGRATQSATALGAANAAASTGAIAGFARGSAAVVRFLGPIGLAASTVYLLYEGYQMLFGDKSDVMKGMEDANKLIADGNKPLTERDKKIADLTKQYDKLAKASQNRKDAATEVNLIEQEEALKAGIEANIRTLAIYAEVQASLKDGSAGAEFFSDKILLAEKSLENQKKTLEAIFKKSGELKGQNSELAALREAEADYVRELSKPITSEADAGFHEVWVNSLIHIREQIALLEKDTSSSLYKLRQGAVGAMDFYKDGVASTTAALMAAQETDHEKFNRLSGVFEESQRKFLGILDALNNSSGMAETAIKDLQRQLIGATTAAVADFDAFAPQVSVRDGHREEFAKAVEVYQNSLLPKEEQRTKWLARQAVLAERVQRIQSGEINAGDVDFEQAAADLDELVSVTSQLSSLEGGSKKAAKAAKDLYSVYESLYRQFDRVGYSAEQLTQTQSDLNSLLNDGRINQEQYNSALNHATAAHVKLKLEETERYKLLKDLNSSYLSTGIDKQVEDLVKLKQNTENLTTAEYALYQQRLLESARGESNIPSIAGMDGTLNSSGPFSEFLNTTISVSQGKKELGDRALTIGQDTVSANLKAEQHMQDMAMQAQNNEELLRVAQDYADRKEAISKASGQRLAQLEMDVIAHQKASNMMQLASMADSLSSVLGMVASAGEDATSAQKAAFVAQKALAVASIIIQTEVAAALVTGQTGIFGIALSTMVRAQGYAAAGMVAGMAIGELAGSGGSSNYSGAYDNGGYIPAGKFGLVGEIGPEIVNGPANVTSRKETAAMLKNGGGNSGPQEVTIAPVINITHESSGSSDAEQDGKMMGNAVKMVVIDTIRKELRPNGMLYRR